MTPLHPRIRQGARTALATLAFTTLALLSACGGDDDGPAHAPQPVASGTDNVNAALSMPPEGTAVATSVDAAAPSEASAPTVIATDTRTAPEATDNDADAPSEPAPSAV
jgi:hypothetical protein